MFIILSVLLAGGCVQEDINEALRREAELNVRMGKLRKWISDASLKINYNGEQTPRNFNDGDWIVSGVGKSMTDEEEILNFEIAESLIRYAESHYLFDKGLLYLRLKNRFSPKEEIVKAEMKTLPGSDRSLQITYKGEVYSY